MVRPQFGPSLPFPIRRLGLEFLPAGTDDVLGIQNLPAAAHTRIEVLLGCRPEFEAGDGYFFFLERPADMTDRSQWDASSDWLHEKSSQSVKPLPSLSSPSMHCAMVVSIKLAQTAATSGFIDIEHEKSMQSV